MTEDMTDNKKSPTWFLVLFDTIVIGIAIQFGIESISTHYSTIGLINTASFFMVSLNFFHGKLTNIADKEYQQYADSRSYQTDFGDFVMHVITLLCFGFMPFFLHNIRVYLICHIFLRLSDMGLVSIVYFTVSSVALGKGKLVEIKKTQRDWFIIDVIIAAVTGILLFLIIGSETAYPIDFMAALVILILGILDISTDYILHCKYYFGER